MITIEEAVPDRYLNRTKPVTEFHAELQRIIREERSVLDTQPAVEWIDNANIRDQRRACLLNILAKLAVLPTPSDPMARHISYVSFADVDRIYVAARPTILGRLKESTKFRRDRLIHSTHERLRYRIFNPRRSDYKFYCYREQENPSLQIVVAKPPEDFDDRTHYADIDIDLGNPYLDVRGLLLHFGELLDPDKTDHLELGSKLAGSESPTKEYLYYRSEVR